MKHNCDCVVPVDVYNNVCGKCLLPLQKTATLAAPTKKKKGRNFRKKAEQLYGPLPTLEQLEKGYPVEIERMQIAQMKAFEAGYKYALYGRVK